MPRPVISLTTDFGYADAYVGAMKGVILGLCPEATLVDICHDIRPQDIRQAAYVLATAAPYFPVGTIHLAVIDPGVGGPRKPIAVATERAMYVAPDNGVLTLALSQDPPCRAVHLADPRFHLAQVSSTFHGRDLFAPAAAHLALGADLQDMGPPIPVSDLVTLPLLEPVRQPDGSWLAQVMHVDRFGNLITSFPVSQLPSPQPTIAVGRQRIAGLSRTFADAELGQFLAYAGSSGYLEIALRNGNAAAALGLGVGAPVQILVGEAA